jgi:hypothetical protein
MTWRLLTAALILGGCATKLVPEAAQVRLADSVEEVQGCRIIRSVRSHPPYITPGDGLNEIKNTAAALGANTVFLTNYPLRGEGVAYSCP